VIISLFISLDLNDFCDFISCKCGKICPPWTQRWLPLWRFSCRCERLPQASLRGNLYRSDQVGWIVIKIGLESRKRRKITISFQRNLEMTLWLEKRRKVLEFLWIFQLCFSKNAQSNNVWNCCCFFVLNYVVFWLIIFSINSVFACAMLSSYLWVFSLF